MASMLPMNSVAIAAGNIHSMQQVNTTIGAVAKAAASAESVATAVGRIFFPLFVSV